jgi:hypothetical protein
LHLATVPEHQDSPKGSGLLLWFEQWTATFNRSAKPDRLRYRPEFLLSSKMVHMPPSIFGYARIMHLDSGI